jgi:hypothetical protein
MPGGMKIVATCCLANTFPTDDTVAIDYTLICNDAMRSRVSLTFSMIVFSAVAMFLAVYLQ